MKTFRGTYSRDDDTERPAKAKKFVATPEQITNDPSLRWVGYRAGEPVWSDTHQNNLRFVRYEGTQIVLATLDGMAELPDSVDQFTVRRLTAR